MGQRILLGQFDDRTRSAGYLCDSVFESANSRSNRDRVDLPTEFGMSLQANEEVHRGDQGSGEASRDPDP